MSSKGIFRLALGLLIGAFLLSAVLAQQAAEASRRHRAFAVRALQDHAAFAAWEAANAARTEISAAHFGAFLGLIHHLGEHPTDIPDVDRLAESVRTQRRVCECTSGIRFFFTLDPDGRYETTAAEPVMRRWVRDTVARIVKALPRPGGPQPVVVRSISSMPRRLAVLILNSGPGSLYGRPGGVPTAVVYLVARDSVGRVVRTFGFVSEPEAFVRPIFTRILDDHPLLPPSLAGGLSPESLVALSVADPSGRLLYQSHEPFPGAVAATDTLPGSQGRLRLGLTLNPVLAERLVGGLPDSRLPVLVAVLVLSAGMLTVLWLTLRRQQVLVRLRDDFVANVSHELRTPLAQIRLLAELLHRGRPLSEESRRRSARIIDQEARRLSMLVENVLNFARVGRGIARVRPVATDLGQEVREIVDAFLPLLHRSESSVRVETEDGVVAAVDPAALRQVLVNLLDNANRYGPPRQRIAVAVRRAGGEAELSVTDEGPGIPASDAQRVFEPYHRLAHDTPGTESGTGIGLAVVRELVVQHEGRVWVERADARAGAGGARFVVRLPLAPADAAAFAEEPDGEALATGSSPAD